MSPSREEFISSQLSVISQDIKSQIGSIARLEANQEIQKDQLKRLEDKIEQIHKTDSAQTEQIISHVKRSDGFESMINEIYSLLNEKQDRSEAERIRTGTKAKYDYKAQRIVKIGGIITAVTAGIVAVLELAGLINILQFIQF